MDVVEQIAVLEDFATANVDLEQLRRLLAKVDTAALERLRDFESFVADDADLEQLKGLLFAADAAAREVSVKFDAIAFAGLSGDELFHSRFLAWLMDPEGNHGTRSYFLEKFLRKTLEQAKNLGIGKATFPEIGKAVWTQTHVQREWYHRVDDHPGSLDILLVNQQEKFLCAIENKVFSGEHSGQLGRYKKALDKDYPHLTKHYVFLSPGGMPPEQEEDQKHWVPMTYTTILELVDTLEKTVAMREDVRVFLQQYVTTLRRNIVHTYSDEVKQRAREIYSKHRKVLELIYRYKPDYQTEMENFFRDALRQHPIWIQGKRGTWQGMFFIRSWSTDWNKYTDFRTGPDWMPSGELLVFEFICKKNSADMKLVLNPGTDEFVRRKIVDSVNNTGQTVFNRAGQAFSKEQMILHYEANILIGADLDKWDAGSYICDKVMCWVESFTENYFPEMNKVIVKCFEGYEAQKIDS